MKQSPQIEIALLKQSQTNLMNQLLEFQKDNTNSFLELKEQLKSMEDKLDSALEKKAGVWVEKVIYGVAIFFLTGLFSYLGVVIVNVIEK